MIFQSLYDVEAVCESAFKLWRDTQLQQTGSGVALQSVKEFFDWLDNAEMESDPESAT